MSADREAARRGEAIDAFSDVILDALPVSGAMGRAALALAFIKRCRADGIELEASRGEAGALRASYEAHMRELRARRDWQAVDEALVSTPAVTS